MVNSGTNNWGDFCTYCGVEQSGEFPRKCANGHYTYPAPVAVSVALQPVSHNGKIGILTVQRGINPYKGHYALPGGFMDNGEHPAQSAVRELFEETTLVQPINDAMYFSSDVGGSHSDKDPRSHTMHFFIMPVLDSTAIDLGLNNNEVQSLSILFLSEDKNGMEKENGEVVQLCFTTHHKAALDFLQSSGG